MLKTKHREEVANEGNELLRSNFNFSSSKNFVSDSGKVKQGQDFKNAQVLNIRTLYPL